MLICFYFLFFQFFLILIFVCNFFQWQFWSTMSFFIYLFIFFQFYFYFWFCFHFWFSSYFLFFVFLFLVIFLLFSFIWFFCTAVMGYHRHVNIELFKDLPFGFLVVLDCRKWRFLSINDESRFHIFNPEII